MKDRILRILFPPKCILCRKVLSENETDLCRDCRENQPEFGNHKIKLSFLAQWTGVWYYKGNVRQSILRYKFGNRRNYAAGYGRLLAMKLIKEGWEDTDLLAWAPISRQRKRRRGFVSFLCSFQNQRLSPVLGSIPIRIFMHSIAAPDAPLPRLS